MQCRKCKKEIADTPFCPYCGAEQKPSEKKNRTRTRGNGQGTVLKRGRTYTARIRFVHDNELRVATKGGFKTRSAALAFIPELKASALYKFTHATPAPQTLADYYRLWYSNHCKDLSDNRINSYDRAWTRLSSLHKLSVVEARYDAIQSIIDATEGYYAQKAIKTVIRGIWKFARKNGEVASNIADDLEISASKPDENKDAFTKAEVEAMWAALPRVPFLAYPLIMIYTGMEPGEIKLLDQSKIDYSERLIWNCGTKNEHRRSVPVLFPEKIEPLLRGYEPFTHKKDKTWFYDEYKAAIEATGIRYLSPNCCRHTTATMLARSKAPFASIQKIMRHSSYKTTLGYTHMALEDEFDALDLIAK